MWNFSWYLYYRWNIIQSIVTFSTAQLVKQFIPKICGQRSKWYMLIKKTWSKAGHIKVFNSVGNINTLFLFLLLLLLYFSPSPFVPSFNFTLTPTITTVSVFMSSFSFLSLFFLNPSILPHLLPPHTHTTELSACSVWVYFYFTCYTISYCWFPLDHIQCLLLTLSPHFPSSCFSSFTIHQISMNLKILEKMKVFHFKKKCVGLSPYLMCFCNN